MIKSAAILSYLWADKAMSQRKGWNPFTQNTVVMTCGLIQSEDRYVKEYKL